MTHDLPRRKPLRLAGYDYAQAGAYFVTIVTQGRTLLFGEIVQDEMRLNAAGNMTEKIWQSLRERFPTVELGEYVVMPNHFHAVIILVGAGLVPARHGRGPSMNEESDASGGVDVTGATTRVAPTGPTLGQIIGAFKSITTHEYIVGVKTLGWPAFDKSIWQRNYYEHIIRSEDAAQRIALYIESNPARWADDKENPSNPS